MFEIEVFDPSLRDSMYWDSVIQPYIKSQLVPRSQTLLSEKKSIVINVLDYFRFEMVVSRHEIAWQPYIDRVNLFLQGTVDADGLVGRLDIRSRPHTERASGAYNPSTGSIAVRDTVGQGGFGVVRRVWDVSTASVYALKDPSAWAIRKNRVDVEAWRKEVRLLSRVSHVS
jgi:hypothetical protein